MYAFPALTRRPEDTLVRGSPPPAPLAAGGVLSA
jgi:hypothetical protein